MKLRLLILVSLSLVITSCSKKPIAKSTAVHVTVNTVQASDEPYSVNYPGIVQGVVDYPVIPRVSGAIFKQYYTEGTFVKKDDPLYLIDPRPFQLDVKNFEGQKIKDMAARDNYKLIYDRYLRLYQVAAVSKQDTETARINYETAVGNVQSDQANIDQARLNILYCLVRSPAAGYVAERHVTVGDMVTAFQTVLNQINSVNDMYILFSMPEDQRLQIENGVLESKLTVPKNYSFRVDIKLADGKVIPNAGHVEFTDTRISLQNGVWNMRAYVDNKTLKNKLLAGQFVNVYIDGLKYLNVFALPQSSILHSDKGPFVYLLKDGKAVMHPIETGKMIGDKWLITSGLQNGDQVISNGVLKIRDGSSVIVDPDQNNGDSKKNLKSLGV